MADELLELVLDEMPDAFRRAPGTAVDKIKAFVKFYQQEVSELRSAYEILPDGLGRLLPERISLLLERANREAEIAAKLRNRLEKMKPGSSSDI
jgi:hypothetical protein